MARGESGPGRAQDEGNEYEERIVAAVRQLVRKLAVVMRKLAAESGITSLELLCLRQVVENGPTSVADIIDDVKMTPRKVIGILDSLEESGLVRLTRDAEKHGSRIVTATEKGMNLYDGIRYPIQTLFDARDRSILDGKDDENVALCLERLVKAVGAERQNGQSPITSIGPVDRGKR
jgi:DNA-binding MarR family transcriptional regulator